MSVKSHNDEESISSERSEQEAPTGLYNPYSASAAFDDNGSIPSLHSQVRSALSRVSSASHSFVRPVGTVVDAVREDNRITEAHKGETYQLMPDTGLALVEAELSRQTTHPYNTNPDGSDPDDFGPEDSDPGYGIPDGGYSWVIVTCTCLLSVATWGANASYGVFLNYYLSSNYFPGGTPFHFAMIGGLVIGMALVTSPFVFIFVSYIGLKPTMLLGCILQTAGYMLASFATTIWQLYLTQGLMVGVSFSLLYNSGISILPNWFYHKRALAAGLTVSGSGIGGIVFSLSCQSLLESTGDQRWPLRMVGIATLVACLVAITLIQQYPKSFPVHRIPTQRPPLGESIRVVLDPLIVRYTSVNLVGLWYALCNTGYIILLFSQAAYATSIGLTKQQGSNVTAVMNVGQVFGRPGIGQLSDMLGRINVSVLLPVLFGVLILAFWVNTTTYASLIAWAVVCGLTQSCGSVNSQPLAVDIAGTAMFPAAFSYICVLVAFPLTFAEVIALELAKKTEDSNQSYLNVQILCGVMFIGAGLSLLVLREQKVALLIRERLKAVLEPLPTGEVYEGKPQMEAHVVLLEEIQLKEKRLVTYTYLLRPGAGGYLSRMTYPIKV